MVKEKWISTHIKDIATIYGRIGFRGYTKQDIVKPGFGAISLSPSNIKDGKVTYAPATYISWEKYEESPEIKLTDGDVVLVKTGSTFGKTAYIDRLPWPTTLNPQIVVFKKLKIHAKLFAYFMASKNIQEQISAVIVGGAIPTLSQEQVYAFDIVYPPDTKEQAAIAKVLSDVDSLISSLQKLIEKKKAIKQGAMQELLTGKKRLPGFSGEWEKNTLKQICEFINGRAYSQHELLSRGKYKVLRLGNLFTNSHWYYTDLELNEKQYCEKGDLLYAWSASFGPTIWDGEKSVFHYHIWKIKCSEMIDKKYLYHFLNADVSSILNELQGGTMFHLTKENMENRLCSYPNLDEQQAIAQVLSDMDCEIEQLEKKLAKYQQIKQGMMQELLTGRIRLKEGENNV